MESAAVIDEIIHEITIMFGSVNAKYSPAINPNSDTIASCMPNIIGDFESNLFFIRLFCGFLRFFTPGIKSAYIFVDN